MCEKSACYLMQSFKGQNHYKDMNSLMLSGFNIIFSEGENMGLWQHEGACIRRWVRVMVQNLVVESTPPSKCYPQKHQDASLLYCIVFWFFSILIIHELFVS